MGPGYCEKAHNRHGKDEDYVTVLPPCEKIEQASGSPPMYNDSVITSAPPATSGKQRPSTPTPSKSEAPGRKHPPTVDAIGTDSIQQQIMDAELTFDDITTGTTNPNTHANVQEG
jgi:hypothetical protein